MDAKGTVDAFSKYCSRTRLLEGAAEDSSRIQEAFIRRSDGKIQLKGSGSKIWEVSLRRKGKEIFLQDAWKNFCEDNRLGNNEFLILWYDGRKYLKVQIIGQNRFERMDNSSNTSVEGASASAPAPRAEIGEGLKQEKREETGNEPGPSVPLCPRKRNLRLKKGKNIRL